MKKMFLRHLAGTLAAAAILLMDGPRALAQNTESPPAMPAQELPAGSEVLASGPIHEAFAKPVSMDPQAPILVPKQPPDNLQELPPSERPAGAGIVWVPGYWAWDSDRSDFVWVTGCWRNSPPSTYWVPGYWLQTAAGWEWIGGFWKPLTAQVQQEIEYLPAPPASIEVEAPTAPPRPDLVWVPGCWYWMEGHYVRRHGYWLTQQVGWVWVPSHFAWTPRGYIFAQGHWDHDMDNRGVLFCPAFFPREVRMRTGFIFSPEVCIDLGMLRINLFVYPRYRHYYFGDYYDDSYGRIGILPWFKCQTVHTWYDPLFVYDRWHFRQSEPHWAANQARGYELRRANRDLRPARTFTEMRTQMIRLPANRRPERPLAESVKVYAASERTPIKFERINSAERQQIAAKATDVRSLREQRNQWEAPAVHQGPEVRQGPAAVPAPRSRNEAPSTSARTVTQPASAARPPAVVSPRDVRVSQPERVAVPTLPRTSQTGDSRFIAKQPPSHPTQEQAHVAPTQNPQPSSRGSLERRTPPPSPDRDRQQ